MDGKYKQLDFIIESKLPKTYECPVCYDEVNMKDSYSLSCGHR